MWGMAGRSSGGQRFPCFVVKWYNQVRPAQCTMLCGPGRSRTPKKKFIDLRITQKMRNMAMEKATRHYTQQSFKSPVIYPSEVYHW